MLYYSFCDYGGFEACSDLKKRDNSVVVKRSKILLTYPRSPTLLKYCKEHNDYTPLHIYNTADLQKKVFEAIIESGRDDEKLPYEMELIGEAYYLSKYKTDEFRSLCKDPDEHSIRYISVERNRVLKMGAGKFIREPILEIEVRRLPLSCVMNWVTGDVFTQRWCTYTYGYTPDTELFVNDGFWRIYNSSYCKRDFSLYMMDEDRTSFYYSSVKAKATYITGKTGLIVARTVLFTGVTDQDDKRWRPPERRYSSEDDDMLKRLLVDKPTQKDCTDDHKVIGASCHQANAFIDINGYSLSDRKFEIECNLEETDTLSHQDSFRWHSYSRSRAYNCENPEALYNLDTTDLNLYDNTDEDGSSWDEHRQCDCDETALCCLHGNAIDIDSENLGDFLRVSPTGEYHHKDDCVCCDNYGENLLEGDTEYSEVIEEHYCCGGCMEKVEDTSKRKNRHYSEHDGK